MKEQILTTISYGDLMNIGFVVLVILCVFLMIWLLKPDEDWVENDNFYYVKDDSTSLEDYEKELGEICDTSKDVNIIPLNDDEESIIEDIGNRKEEE